MKLVLLAVVLGLGGSFTPRYVSLIRPSIVHESKGHRKIATYHPHHYVSAAESSSATPLLAYRVMYPSVRSRVSEKIQILRTKLLSVGPIAKWRIAAVTFLSTLLLSRRFLDVQLAKLWTYLLTSSAIPARIFRTDSYEWCLAVASFGIFIHAFGYVDRLVRLNPSHPWRKFRLQDRYEADRLRRKQGEFDNMPSVKQSPWHWRAWIFEFWIYVLPLLVWDIVSPRRHRRIGGFAAPTTLQVMRDVSLGLLLYDFFFFFGHLAMHKIPFLYKHFHKKHHEVDEVRACDQVRLTLGEEVYDVGCSIVALNLLGVHPVARTMYNLIIVFLLCELHSGFDFPWTPQNVVPKGLMTGSRRHHFHHRFGEHYYQKFFFSLDRLFGFFQKDDGSLKGDTLRHDPYIPSEWKRG